MEVVTMLIYSMVGFAVGFAFVMMIAYALTGGE